MSWLDLDKLPALLRSSIESVQFSEPVQPGMSAGWDCGCLCSRDCAAVWLCSYHEGFWDGMDAAEEGQK